ncbi:uncharacterized protein CANTADRAFT_25902 [Suhomyces tanzawaensis NRRL Y-17324]|uniref:Zn(2)-C6 fungal-type domain-containing protein n=1 Tax=Suhomyces tanzawaensis NRRL Y-17324 TaxID=984487 RepID=A0A1E4SL54_9ASCO|nr:uncharacterized protein CANTADRAFT_25902 [Suhomyces tanzawaensis NRRL Y-17324]ODV80233.1 hypothetical protein CANTADRAFT_25902 [Suhomyces tanzawaensis NRRL Y-17324]
MTEPTKKRKRLVLSCDNCRTRKTKCDRNLPCSNCIKLSIGHRCTFSSPNHINHSKLASLNTEPDGNDKSKIISELESLKLKLQSIEGSIGNSSTSQSISPEASIGTSSISAIPSNSKYSFTDTEVSIGSPSNFISGLLPQVPVHPQRIVQPGLLTSTSLLPLPAQLQPLVSQQNSDTQSQFFHSLPSIPNIAHGYALDSSERRKPSLKELFGTRELKYLIESEDAIRQANKDLYLGINPIVPDPKFFNLHFCIDSTNLIKPSIPPLPLRCLLRRDPGCCLFWNQHELSTKIFFSFPTKGTNKGITALDIRAQRKLGDQHIKQIEDGFTMDEVKLSCSNYGRHSGVYFCPKSLSKQSLLEKIATLLPETSVCEQYVDLFFENLYVFFPIIDESQFREDIGKIVKNTVTPEGTFKDHKRIVIEKRHDLATISIYLFILRLSYISQFRFYTKDTEETLGEYSIILTRGTELAIQNPVPTEVAEVAEDCLKSFTFTRKQDMVVLQGAILSRIHDRYSPDIGDKPSNENPACTAMLVQMATNLGMHRDPDYIMELSLSSNQKHLRRKIWHYLVSMDVYETIFYGTPITVNLASYDTKVPFYVSGVGNTKKEETEREAVKIFQLHRSIILTTSKLSEILLRIKDQVSMSSIIDQINDFEIIVARSCSRLSAIMKPQTTETDAFRIKTIHIYLHSKMFLAGMYYYFFTYYHDLGVKELEFFYFKKALITIFVELNDLMKIVIFNDGGVFGQMCAMLISPIINLINSFACMITLSLCIRLTATSQNKNSKFTVKIEHSEEEDIKLQELMQVASACTRDLLFKLSITSKRFINAWKAKKAMFHGLSILLKGPIFNDSTPNTYAISFNSDQLRQINDILNGYSKIAVTEEVDPSRVLQSFQSMNFETAEDLNLDEKKEEYLISEIQLDHFWRQMKNIKMVGEQDWLRTLESTGSDYPIIENNLVHGTAYFADFDLFDPSIMDTFGDPFST